MIIELPNFIHELFPADGEQLLRVLTAKFTEDDCIAIANCDSVEGSESHHAAVRAYFLNHEPMELHHFCALEQIQLTRWNEASSRRDHVRRGACSALLVGFGSTEESSGHAYGLEDSLASLVSSCMFLGDSYVRALGQYVVWRCGFELEDGESLFFVFTLLLVGLRLGITEGQSSDLVLWIEQRYKILRDSPRPLPDYDLYGDCILSASFFNQRAIIWKRLASWAREKFVEWPEVCRLCDSIIDSPGRFKTFEPREEFDFG